MADFPAFQVFSFASSCSYSWRFSSGQAEPSVRPPAAALKEVGVEREILNLLFASVFKFLIGIQRTKFLE